MQFKFRCYRTPNHGFADGGFDRSLARIGPLVGPISEIIMRLGHDIEDEGASPEMRRLFPANAGIQSFQRLREVGGYDRK